jgi:hypothetical protein
VTRGQRFRRFLAITCVAMPFVLCASSASAQSRPRGRAARAQRPAPRAGSWEISGGIVWAGGFDLGTTSAELTRNPTTGTGSFDLFSADSKLASGVGVQGRLSGYLSANLAIEAGARLTRPVLRSHVSADVETSTATDVEETLSQYVIDGSVVWHLSGARFNRGRGVPFVSAGAGYIRDLHEENQVIETGTEYHATAGLKLWFSDRPRRLGLRAEAGVSIRDGGIDFREGRRTVPIANASLAYLF